MLFMVYICLIIYYISQKEINKRIGEGFAKYTLKSFLTSSGEESHDCMYNGFFIATKFGGNLASKSKRKQN